jgi:iron complex outermembrane recepter protein
MNALPFPSCRPWRIALSGLAALGALASARAALPAAPESAVADLSLEQLGTIEVTSVTGRPQSVNEAAACVYVITAEDIRRSTATSLPEALRLAPNLQVARLDSGQYAISARGFNNAIGNKLLVMIDGRTVYSPLFSGVFWDAQDVMLEDVERIEVISGAGATLWGANAVNGVINVITRAAGLTQGVRATAHGGVTGDEVAVRYGARPSDELAWRVYAMEIDRDATHLSSGARRDDAATKQHAGFRLDWQGASDRATVQGDAYQGGGDKSQPMAATVAGANLLMRWRRESADGSNWQLQGYVDEARRVERVEFQDDTRTLDLQFSQVPAMSEEHRLIWGAGYRRAVGDTRATPLVLFDPAVKTLSWGNVFAQDEVRLSERLHVTAGAKVETNVYTGAEFLPTLRATYAAGDAATLWASASRAVRAPARLDRDFYFPGKAPFVIEGGPHFDSEVADVYELGWRGQRLPGFGYSLTAFHDVYSKLRAGRAAPTTVDNLAGGSISGIEAWASVDLRPDLRLSAGWMGLDERLHAAPGAGARSVANLGDDPRRQWSLRLTSRLSGRVECDLALRHVSALPNPAVPAYTVADVRLAWQASPDLQVSLLGQELGRRHVEFDPASSSRFGPTAFLKLDWRLRG